MDNYGELETPAMKTPKIFVSQAMHGRPEAEILKEREQLIAMAHKRVGENAEVIDSYFRHLGDANPRRLGHKVLLVYLAENIRALADADVAVFGKSWRFARGCRIEHQCCEEYNIPTMDTEAW